MTQVRVLTIDHRELVSLNNRRAEYVEHPPKGSPYKLTKGQREIVRFVTGSCFHNVEDMTTGIRYRTREWQKNWLGLTLQGRNNIVKKELDKYLGTIIQLDGVTDVFGHVKYKYIQPPTGGTIRQDILEKKYPDFVVYVDVEVRKGTPDIIEDHVSWIFDDSKSTRLDMVGVRSTKELIAAIAKHSEQLKVTT